MYLNSQNFNFISEYLIKLRKPQEYANYIVPISKRLLNRELLKFFLDRIPFHLRQMSVVFGSDHQFVIL